jgi:hypothetical protein
MLLAAKRPGSLLQIGAVIKQQEEWLRIGIHQFSEINS